MKKIVECVPNFSEGRDEKIISAIAEAISAAEGVTLLDVDPGKSTNRTVYTFVGSPEAVVEGALAGARAARGLIDMRRHTGEHPRMGALDVCPFIPVSNVTMEECSACAEEFARRASEELGIPLYLYEHSQEKEYRKSLPDIRSGEYEGLEAKMTKAEWKPDYGEPSFVPEWGATVTGARNFLIAYNINILGTYNQAHRIALDLREAGRGDQEKGKLKELKALGWHVDEYNMAQISMNLTNYNVTPPHIAFEEARGGAASLGVAVAGSELVGLIPLEAILMAAEYYIEKEGLFIISEDQKIKLAVDRLGLNSVAPFVPEKKIIEYMIKEDRNEPLASLTVRDFVAAVAARTAAPGGGSVSAAAAAMGAGLGAMVSQLTYGVRKFEDVEHHMKAAIPALVRTADALIPKIDEDTDAFNDYIDAMRLPKESEEEKAVRETAMQAGIKKAIETPLSVMRLAGSVWKEMEICAVHGNIASKSDVEVGVRALELGCWGAYRNVMINMATVSDEKYKEATLAEAETIMLEAKRESERILQILDNRK